MQWEHISCYTFIIYKTFLIRSHSLCKLFSGLFFSLFLILVFWLRIFYVFNFRWAQTLCHHPSSLDGIWFMISPSLPTGTLLTITLVDMTGNECVWYEWLPIHTVKIPCFHHIISESFFVISQNHLQWLDLLIHFLSSRYYIGQSLGLHFL